MHAHAQPRFPPPPMHASREPALGCRGKLVQVDDGHIGNRLERDDHLEGTQKGGLVSHAIHLMHLPLPGHGRARCCAMCTVQRPPSTHHEQLLLAGGDEGLHVGPACNGTRAQEIHWRSDADHKASAHSQT